ncbi:MAG: hypothetical protein A2Y07_10970 [Planctomycetes bacterium GWF2_50_10]|nr:MAG: hypothetical protein A2Y07_10970 [Planctomycetes bacterium GWF2_50_10]
MDRVQRKLVRHVFTICFLTLLFVFTMINFKDVVTKRESMIAMGELGKFILDYRSKMGSLPSQYTVESVIPSLRPNARLGPIQYRAPWIGYDAGPDTIVVYSSRDFNSFLLEDGAVVLTLDGKVHFWDEEKFRETLSHQQSQAEIRERSEVFSNPYSVPNKPGK